ncbi:MAG: hypothetical protein AOA65_1847 [Candidatus Bathyarchaeota archaeon BA1]|nr:MAG: hypothetical protein AOA65_1847 [Candidatus Bathyarchaeota archaeon BA1]
MSNQIFLSESEKRCLALILRRQKAERSPYIPIPFLKLVPDYKRVLKELNRKALVSYYKKGEAVGLSEDGLYLALALIREGY